MAAAGIPARSISRVILPVQLAHEGASRSLTLTANWPAAGSAAAAAGAATTCVQAPARPMAASRARVEELHARESIARYGPRPRRSAGEPGAGRRM